MCLGGQEEGGDTKGPTLSILPVLAVLLVCFISLGFAFV